MDLTGCRRKSQHPKRIVGPSVLVNTGGSSFAAAVNASSESPLEPIVEMRVGGMMMTHQLPPSINTYQLFNIVPALQDPTPVITITKGRRWTLLTQNLKPLIFRHWQ